MLHKTIKKLLLLSGLLIITPFWTKLIASETTQSQQTEVVTIEHHGCDLGFGDDDDNSDAQINEQFTRAEQTPPNAQEQVLGLILENYGAYFEKNREKILQFTSNHPRLVKTLSFFAKPFYSKPSCAVMMHVVRNKQKYKTLTIELVRALVYYKMYKYLSKKNTK